MHTHTGGGLYKDSTHAIIASIRLTYNLQNSLGNRLNVWHLSFVFKRACVVYQHYANILCCVYRNSGNRTQHRKSTFLPRYKRGVGCPEGSDLNPLNYGGKIHKDALSHTHHNHGNQR